MKHFTLVCAYGLLVWTFASMRSAAADCDREIVPLVGSEPPFARSASSDSVEQGGQRNLAMSPADSPPSADPDSREVVNRLAIMYARGRGLPKRPRLALKLFQKLAVEGYAPAMVNLGTIYELGLASRPDHRRAYAWIRAGLSLGVPEEDRDATAFKLGMIAARLNTVQIRAAELFATSITEAIAAQCQSRDQKYTYAVLMGESP
jgi:TPR repeat protein